MRRLSGVAPVSFIISEMKDEKQLRYALIIYAALLGVASAFLLWNGSPIKRMLLAFFTMVLLIGLLIYFVRYFPCFRAIRWLTGKSLNIYDVMASGSAVISPTPVAVIPYSQIAWVYLDPVYAEADTPIGFILSVHCKDGALFEIQSDPEGWYHKIVAAVPDVLSGPGAQMLQRYLRENPAARKKWVRSKVIWGSVLVLLAAAILVSGLIRNAVTSTALIILVPLFLGGGWLLWQGYRYNKQ